MSTAYHATYMAHALSKRCASHQMEKLGQSIINAVVDLNPHQLDAALFAFKSPLSRGAILADEVGLGKTIEAGLILSQLWAERHRRILCIVPASLRKQWQQELKEKFFIPSTIMESKNFNALVKEGSRNPFDQPDQVVICSYQFARNKEIELRSLQWDLVVIDEAHRLRNVYKKSNKIARSIQGSIGDRPKVLLTATPLQNSLMELFGLVSFVDPHIFGNEFSFRAQFARNANDMGNTEFRELRSRIQPVCQRTLRRQVIEYIRYTNRVSLTQDFTPTDEEVELYEAVSSYLQRPSSFALPASQRSLMTLVLRKILASSSFAISGTLDSLIQRLEAISENLIEESEVNSVDALSEDYETFSEDQEEWTSDDDESSNPLIGLSEEEQEVIAAIRSEIDELKEYKSLAESITVNAKGEALLTAISSGFAKLSELGAPAKCLIFTESRRTQKYLFELLSANGFDNDIVTLNGTNTDPLSREIYKQWQERHQDDDSVSGSRTSDLRAALVEEFRDRRSIMIATESGAEGINLQFCSLLVNFDLPWNPQRIEQRIGRCHRYGQQHDVVVVNFLNRRNAADQRVFELLSEKLRLFDGVFGASDEILGALESGVDFEKTINEIYQSCRTPEEINTAFDTLQRELDEQISAAMQDARNKLMEHFDEDVHSRLKMRDSETEVQINRFEEWLWKLTQIELDGFADFDSSDLSFVLHDRPSEVDPEEVPLGRYRLVTRKNGLPSHQYRLGHPLAEWIMAKAKTKTLPPSVVVFRYSNHPTMISLVKSLQGQSGWLRLSQITLTALEEEQHLVFIGQTDEGVSLDGETSEKLFNVSGSVESDCPLPEEIDIALTEAFEQKKRSLIADLAERNGEYFEQEMEKLEKWADDLKESLEQKIKDLDREIKAIKRDARRAPNLEAKLELHKEAKSLERKRIDLRKNLFEMQDDIDDKKEGLISKIEERLEQKTESTDLFTIRWTVQ